MSWVIKHTDEQHFIYFAKRGPVWVTNHTDASPFASKEDAAIEIKRYGIPYCKPKELSKRA